PQASFARHTWTYDGCTDYRDDYPLSNIEQSASRLSVLDATRRSSNTGYVYMANQLNMCDIGEVAESMGVHRASGPDQHGNLLSYNPSFVVGTNEVSPLSMAAAFATYANNGTYCEPIAIISITDADGKELPVPESNCREVISPEVSAGVTHALQTVTSSSGTANQAGIPGRPTAGKTGTSNSNYDAWFVGYVPQAATAVWVGHSEGQESMNYQSIGGRYYGQVYGGAIAAPIWRTYMEPATKDWEVKSFPSAPEKMIYGERKQVPTVLGQSVNNAEKILTEAGFSVTVGEKGYSDRYPEGVIGWQSSMGRERPGSTITIRPSAGPEPDSSDEDSDDKDSSDSKNKDSKKPNKSSRSKKDDD
ncbi:MAG TPA: penicillin-binding transpeptidase domain-containing protein, partial [Beutenbergiaceae bacterium]|nr:penicillin-binding transpeptidase domain-containing protein [Beutenbergiaceae bacterium]